MSEPGDSSIPSINRGGDGSSPRDLAGLAIDEGVRPVAQQSAVGQLAGVELLPHHRFHRIAPQPPRWRPRQQAYPSLRVSTLSPLRASALRVALDRAAGGSGRPGNREDER